MFEIQAKFFVFGWIFYQKQCWLSEQPVCFSNNKAKRYEKSQILVLEIRKEIVSKIGKTKKQEKLHPMLEICLVESLANRTFFAFLVHFCAQFGPCKCK